MSQDDLAIWQKAVEKITPVAPRPDQKPTIANNRPNKVSLSTPDPIRPFNIGERTGFIKATRRPQVALPERILSPDMDKRNFTRLRKGRFHVDARLDLHGQTLAVAHTTLKAFILKCHQDKKRLLLVITGKSGDHRSSMIMPERRGVLKQQVPQWLRLPPLSAMILETTIATRKHGGEGALYVYLKRQR